MIKSNDAKGAAMTPESAFSALLMGLWKQYWWFFLLLIFWPLLKPFVPKIKGRIGEGVVNLAAKLRLDPEIYHLLKDVTIPSKNGAAQIDHVIVSVFGLFVIETKNYNGWIFADAKSPQWTQVNFKQKHRFQNPLRQNYAHICALSDLLGIPKDKIHGVVCFMGDAKFKTSVPEGVFLEGRYINHIESFRTVLFSENEVANLLRQIEAGRFARGSKTDRQHVQQLKTRHEPFSAGTTCPKCGAGMVLRTAKKGPNTGNQFWGCSTYPACKTVRPV